jgi:tetratricopeptide (TPR) repeat protein
MAAFDPTIDAAFREYAELELRCHYLLLEGKENAPETLEAEDRMTALWEKLDEVQRRSLKGMGSDLNWVRRKGQPPPKGRKGSEEVPPTEQQELVTAIGAKEWHKVLHYLRLCAPSFPVDALAHHRARIYEALGLPNYASTFYEQAADLDPANADIGLKALSTMKKSRPASAVRRAEKIIGLPLRCPPAVLALAAAMILQRDETDGRPIDGQRFSALLNDVVKRLQLEPANEARIVAYQAAAAGFEVLDDLTAAMRCLDEGLKLSPNTDELLVFKGLLQYGSQPNQAVDAFAKLTQRGTRNVWPYVFLAHFYLLKRNYGASLEMGREAWARDATNPVRAQLLEWQAICQTQLQYPREVIRPIFEKAISLDPSNSWIARNLAAFDARVAQTNQSEWHIEEAPPLMTRRAGSAISLEPTSAA